MNLFKKAKWVSCKERTPTEEKNYFVKQYGKRTRTGEKELYTSICHWDSKAPGMRDNVMFWLENYEVPQIMNFEIKEGK